LKSLKPFKPFKENKNGEEGNWILDPGYGQNGRQESGGTKGDIASQGFRFQYSFKFRDEGW
jgi:hypothetical protein